MGHLGLIIEREYLNKVTNKSFILATFLTPLIIVGFSLLIGYLTSVNNDAVKNISVVDQTGYFTNSLTNSDDLIFHFINMFDCIPYTMYYNQYSSPLFIIFNLIL